MKDTRFAFHCHHDRLIDYCTDFAERVTYIKSHKPAGEQELRLRLFKLIPEERLPSKLMKDQAKYGGTQAECDKAWAKYMPELEKLHTELCPDCPFDKSNIFTRKDKDGKWY